MFLPFDPGIRKNASLQIYTGIHDGHTGSVPVSHSMDMFNRLALEISPGNRHVLVSDTLRNLILNEKAPVSNENPSFLGDRKIHLSRKLPNLSLTIFEGGHEMIVPQALSLLPVSLPE